MIITLYIIYGSIYIIYIQLSMKVICMRIRLQINLHAGWPLRQ